MPGGIHRAPLWGLPSAGSSHLAQSHASSWGHPTFSDGHEGYKSLAPSLESGQPRKPSHPLRDGLSPWL